MYISKHEKVLTVKQRNEIGPYPESKWNVKSLQNTRPNDLDRY